MNGKYKRFSPLALIVAGLAALGAFGWFIVNGKFDLYLQIALGVAVLGLAVAVLLDPDGVRQMITGRKARYGSNALVITMAFLGILVVLNVLVYQNDQKLDLTQDKVNTLAPESIKTLQSLPDVVQAKLFVTGQSSYATEENLLKLYQSNSKGKFTYKIINPTADPVAANQANVSRDGDIVLTMGTRQEKATAQTEDGITGAMVRLMSSGQRKIYFLTGHGEHSITESSDSSYVSLKSQLEAKNYVVADLNLLTSAAVPNDAKIIVIGGPQKPLNEAEINAIKAFTDKGGSLIVMADPSLLTQYNGAADLLAKYLESDWGVKLEDDIVIDIVGQQQLGQPLLAVGSEFGTHAIVKNLTGFVTIFPSARTISFVQTSSGVSPEKLVSTSNQSWGETDLQGLKNNTNPEANPATDHMGPVTLAAAAENFTSKGRLVVFGSSQIVVNQIIGAYGNADLFIGSVDWASGQESLISLTPKTTTTRTLKLTPSLYTMGLILLLSVFVMPAIPLVLGIISFIQRRRR